MILRDGRWKEAIERLDPTLDAHEISLLLIDHVFCVDTLLALEIAQLRTFGIPSISRLLHRTGEYEKRGQRRLDDTRAILTEINQAPPKSSHRQAMVEHLNRIHGQYRISNDDYLYTLSTFVFDPALWMDRFGFRSLTAHEIKAVLEHYRVIGTAMGIRDIPQSPERFLAWRRAYEQAHQCYAPSNEAVARGMLQAIDQLLPGPLRPFSEEVVVVLMADEGLRQALGLKFPRPWLKRAVLAWMNSRRRVLRRINFWQRAKFTESYLLRTYPSYPNGYDPFSLGPQVKGRPRAAGLGRLA